MLRSLTVIALLLSTATSAWALSCAQPRPLWWPGGATLPAQPFLVLDNEALESAWFAGPSRIEATVTVVDGYQVIRPKTPLKVGATYTLKGNNKSRFIEGPWRWVGDTRTPLTWTIKLDSSAAPTWHSEIVVGEGAARRGGWGPTSSQILTLNFDSAGPALAEIKLVRGAAKHTLLLPVESGKPLRFGQGLCDGEVQLIGAGAWTATVTLIGPSGQRSAPKTATFVTPAVKGLPGMIGR